jgi:thymidylate synthase (FAD)
MKVKTASFEILDFPENAIDKICIAARTCYKSEPKDEKSNENLVRKLIKLQHLTPLEMASITVRIVCDRGVLAELTRHRLASFNVESTRYANYSKDKFGNEITVIKPCFWQEESQEFALWVMAMVEAERSYLRLIKSGATPEQARSVLPNSLKTEIIMTCNVREMLHIFNLRCSDKAHPQIKEIMIPLRDEMRRRCPAIFGEVD